MCRVSPEPGGLRQQAGDSCEAERFLKYLTAWIPVLKGKPTLIIAHNKTLAARLYGEFKEMFPENVVEYFVS